MPEVQRRLAVCRLGAHRTGTAYTGVWGPHTLRWLFDPANPVSLASFWSQVSGGAVSLSATVLDVGVLADDALVTDLVNADRRVGIRACAGRFADRDIDLAGYDGVVFCVQGSPANAGAGGIVAGRKVVPAALFDELGSHSFMSHEVGHVLGLQHPFRTFYLGSRHGEYGDPTCIMSAESYGGEPVVFGLTPDPASGIPAAARFWTSAGPGVSLASLWRYTSGFRLLPGVEVLIWPSYAQRVTELETETLVTLNRPGLGGTTVAVVHDEELRTYHFVEYRPAAGWDRALGSSGRASSQPGVVIHTLRTFGTTRDGAGWPKPDHVLYLRTLREEDLDSDWDNGRFAVRLGSITPDRATVRIGRDLVGSRSLRVLRRETTMLPDSRRPSGLFAAVMSGPRCELRQVELDAVSRGARITIEVATAGYSEATVEFVVGNRADRPFRVSSDEGAGAATETLDAACLVEVPTGADTSQARTMNVRLTCALAGRTLTLEVPPGLGTVHLPVRVTADERFTPRAPRTHTLDFTVPTFGFELPPGAARDRDTCLAALRDLGEDEVAPKELRPGDLWMRIPIEHWDRLDLVQKAAVLAEIRHLERLPPAERVRGAATLRRRLADPS